MGVGTQPRARRARVADVGSTSRRAPVTGPRAEQARRSSSSRWRGANAWPPSSGATSKLSVTFHDVSAKPSSRSPHRAEHQGEAPPPAPGTSPAPKSCVPRCGTGRGRPRRPRYLGTLVEPRLWSRSSTSQHTSGRSCVPTTRQHMEEPGPVRLQRQPAPRAGRRARSPRSPAPSPRRRSPAACTSPVRRDERVHSAAPPGWSAPRRSATGARDPDRHCRGWRRSHGERVRSQRRDLRRVSPKNTSAGPSPSSSRATRSARSSSRSRIGRDGPRPAGPRPLPHRRRQRLRADFGRRPGRRRRRAASRRRPTSPSIGPRVTPARRARGAGADTVQRPTAVARPAPAACAAAGIPSPRSSPRPDHLHRGAAAGEHSQAGGAVAPHPRVEHDPTPPGRRAPAQRSGRSRRCPGTPV